MTKGAWIFALLFSFGAHSACAQSLYKDWVNCIGGTKRYAVSWEGHNGGSNWNSIVVAGVILRDDLFWLGDVEGTEGCQFAAPGDYDMQVDLVFPIHPAVQIWEEVTVPGTESCTNPP